MTTAALRAELRALLLAVPSLPVVAWELRDYVPVLSTPWVRETLRAGQWSLVTLGPAGFLQARFTYLLDLFQPRGAGQLTTSEELSDRIFRVFYPGRLLGSLAGGQIEAVERAAVEPEPDWLMVPITVAGLIRRPTRS